MMNANVLRLVSILGAAMVLGATALTVAPAVSSATELTPLRLKLEQQTHLMYNGDTHTYRVRLNRAPAAGESPTVRISVRAPADRMSLSPLQWTFSGSEWRDGKLVTVTGIPAVQRTTHAYLTHVLYADVQSGSPKLHTLDKFVGGDYTVNLPTDCQSTLG